MTLHQKYLLHVSYYAKKQVISKQECEILLPKQRFYSAENNNIFT